MPSLERMAKYVLWTYSSTERFKEIDRSTGPVSADWTDVTTDDQLDLGVGKGYLRPMPSRLKSTDDQSPEELSTHAQVVHLLNIDVDDVGFIFFM